MTKELQIMKAFNEIDERYLLELEETSASRPAKQNRLKRPARWLLVAIIVLCISASAYAAIQWHPVFMEWFKPSDAIIEQTSRGVQNVDVVSQCGDFTLRIDQTIGDEDTLYLNLEIALSEGVTWKDVLPEYIWKDKEYVVLIPKYRFCHGVFDYEEIKGLTEKELKAMLQKNNVGIGSGSMQMESLNADGNNMKCILSCSAEDLTADPISLFITGFMQDIEPILLDEGPLVISWIPENTGKQYSFEIADGKNSGELELSAFRLYVKLYPFPEAAKYNKVIDFAKDILFHMKDGTTVSAYALSSGGGGSLSQNYPNKNYAEYHCHFRSILNLEEVKAIQIHDYWFELK